MAVATGIQVIKGSFDRQAEKMGGLHISYPGQGGNS